MEKIFNVKAVGVKYFCSKCEVGEMLPTGKMNIHDKYAMFIHKCNSCENEMEFTQKYPLVRYEWM